MYFLNFDYGNETVLIYKCMREAMSLDEIINGRSWIEQRYSFERKHSPSGKRLSKTHRFYNLAMTVERNRYKRFDR